MAFLIILVIVLSQLTLISSTYLDLLNPSNGEIWQPVKFADIPKSATIRLPNLKSDVKVIFDKWGVPYIFGDNFEDVFRVFGYIQARDRLFQMDMYRRLIEGRLSEILGEITFDTDVFYRNLGLKQAANESLKAIQDNFPQLYGYFQAFAEGINYYIDNGPLPLEFRLLGYRPDKWEVINSLEVAKFIEWGLTGSFWDIERSILVEALGVNKVDEIFPMVDYNLFPILRNNETIYEGSIKTMSQENKQKYESITDTPLDKLNDRIELLKWLQMASGLEGLKTLRGSNNWVVGGNYTYSGKPLLANDPHLSLMVPPIWYEAQLVVKNQMYVRGVTFPGIPVIIIGHNDKVAWGVTNVGADVIDFYYYKWKDNETYYYNGSWMKINKREEVIKITTGEGLVEKTIYINSTIHGPLWKKGTAKYAMRWTGYMGTLEAVAVFMYDTAKNISDFIEGLKFWHIPGQNLVYADIYGNIMYYPSAQYPIRKNILDNSTVAGNMPFNGSNMEGEWVGFIPFEEIPHVINLPRGFVVTANNRPDAGTLPYYWGDSEYFADPYRAMRITQMIEETLAIKGFVDISDFKRIQGDVYSITAEEFLPHLIDALNNAELNNVEQEAFNILKTWNYQMFTNLTAPTIYSMWLYVYREKVFRDEYNANDLTNVRLPKVSTLEYLTENPEMFQYWIDDKSTTNKNETLNEILITSFKEAVSKLIDKMGTDPSKWEFGKIHKMKIEHPLGSVLPWLNYQALPRSGSHFEVNVAPFNPDSDSWYTSLGPSWREIIDLSDLDNSICVIPGGQSGNPYSDHYDDQYYLWINVEYKEMLFPKSPEELDTSVIEGQINFIGGS